MPGWRGREDAENLIYFTTASAFMQKTCASFFIGLLGKNGKTGESRNTHTLPGFNEHSCNLGLGGGRKAMGSLYNLHNPNRASDPRSPIVIRFYIIVTDRPIISHHRYFFFKIKRPNKKNSSQ
jgi:hypothetical protein